MLFWNRKNIEFEKLKTDVDKIKENIECNNSDLIKKIKKLERIIKYSIDGDVSFHLGCLIDWHHWSNVIFLYVNKEEYKIEVAGVDFRYADPNGCSLKFMDDAVYFDALIDDGSKSESKWRKYSFVIDYFNGRYVLIKKVDVEHDKKENE